VWTRLRWSNAERAYAGTIGGKPFLLLIKPAPGCSDGMSDRRYAYTATLTAGGEQQQGCAFRH
jgi:uncharacterized membrane protein